MNVKSSFQLINELYLWGVRDFVVCAGARNAPFIHVLENLKKDINVYSFFEERSAGFFALGKIKKNNKPTVVITTSGTAVANLLPSVIEAHYTGLPLVIISCDRPQSYRGSGAPQSIDQVGIFSNYVEKTWDIAINKFLDWVFIKNLSKRKPHHINVCIDEPLIDEAIDESLWQEPKDSTSVHELKDKNFSEQIDIIYTLKFPLILIGGLKQEDRAKVKAFLLKLKSPFYAEAASGLREDAELDKFRIKCSEKILPKIEFKSILRIGSVPTMRFWRDLEGKFSKLPVVSVSHLAFKGLSRHSKLVPLSLLETVEVEKMVDKLSLATLEQDKSQCKNIQSLLAKFPNSEQAIVSKLSQVIPSEQMVFLGNSLPIREWNEFASYDHPHPCIEANRGANGIDGIISTSLGLCSSNQPVWAIVGDLTAMYDMSALWPLSPNNQQSKLEGDFKLVIVNNGGGKIFEQKFKEKLFLNTHTTDFKSLANFWNVDYTTDMSIAKQYQRCICELKPDSEQTAQFFKEYNELFE
ncbi:MAG: 2-succinyl-5-enolpyruvyl-6-hydroxy-3-cyclohexene-1-carboxylic-acid synthase [Bdellovibrionales bacterium]|nr:2-succinyl-5-enolpyruvyl-6-hydroxy-3-cyclohexene-1-carboxylic-acid synthase [Bdellovibrionales bacterium]